MGVLCPIVQAFVPTLSAHSVNCSLARRADRIPGVIIAASADKVAPPQGMALRGRIRLIAFFA